MKINIFYYYFKMCIVLGRQLNLQIPKCIILKMKECCDYIGIKFSFSFLLLLHTGRYDEGHRIKY